jgi:hypothetical protein
VVVISNIESGEVLERWQFDIECDKTVEYERYLLVTLVLFFKTYFHYYVSSNYAELLSYKVYYVS